MAITHDYLSWVLPNEGWYCAYVVKKSNGAKFNKHFATTDELADFLLEQDRIGNTVYYACASYQTDESRKSDNVKESRSLHLDIDSRTTHPTAAYADAREAAYACAGFCRSAHLPQPIYVASGGGVYAVWVFKTALAPEDWLRYARSLKQLCRLHNLHADPARTSDLSSVLRAPGTFNRKHLAVEVKCGSLGERHDWSRFQHAFQLGGIEGINTVHPRPVQHSRLIDAALELYGPPTSDCEFVAERCNQIGEIRNDPSRYSEPIIYAAAGVVRHCANPAAATTWFDPEWRAAWQQKLDHHRASNVGPTTCAHFQALNPEACQGCPHQDKITSPIQLGQAEGSDPPTSRPELPKGFVINEQGQLVHKGEGKGGKDAPTLICNVPIAVEAVQHAEIDPTKHRLVFDFGLPHSPAKVVLDHETFFGASGHSKMAGQGVMIHDFNLFKRYVMASVDDWNTHKMTEVSYDQFGWKSDDTAFLWGNRLYADGAYTTVTGSPELEYRAQFLRPVGSLGRWQAAANQFFAEGFEPQSVALLSSLASPLMRFHSREEGGAVVSFISPLTGGGKSTGLKLAASVWGTFAGIKLDETDTRVAKGIKLGVFGNLPCHYDELRYKDTDAIIDFIKTFTGGKDKDRGTINGTLAHNKATWQLVLMLASNKPITDLLLHSNDPASAARILEFNSAVKNKDDWVHFDEVCKVFETNYGHAAHHFLCEITRPDTLQYIKNFLSQWTHIVQRECGLDNDHRYWVRLVVCTLVAGEIAKKSGLLDFSVERYKKWIFDYIRKGAVISKVRVIPAGELISMFVTDNWGQILIIESAYRPKQSAPVQQMPKNKIVARWEKEEQRLFVSEHELRKYLLGRNVHLRPFEEECQAKEIFGGEKRRVTLLAGTGVQGSQTYCYDFNLKHPELYAIMEAATKPVSNVVQLRS